MKKLSILLILTMIISLIPALNISAAGEEYYLKGIYEGATVVIQHEPTKTVTLVDAALNGKTSGNGNNLPPVLDMTATNVSKVVYTFNDNAPETIMGANLSYTMTFTELGTQTLKYDVYKTTGDGVTPDQSTTVTFNVVTGKKSAESFTEDFENVSKANLAKAIVANDGENISSVLAPALDIAEWKGGNALTIKRDAITSTTTYLQFRGADARSGNKVHYYEFRASMRGQYWTQFGVVSDFSNASSVEKIFTNKQLHTYSTNGAKIGFTLDYNANVGVVYVNGVEWKQVSLSAVADAENPVFVMSFDKRLDQDPLIDDFSYTAYDTVPVPSFGNPSIPGGDKPVLETLAGISFTGTDFLEGQNAENFATLAQKPNDGSSDYRAATVDYDVAINGSNIEYTFNGALTAGTTYQVIISGIKDSYLNVYNDYEFTFRTLNEGENPLPEITLTSPVADERYYPNESTITLAADAFDTLGGSIAKVEFFVDGVLIGEGTNVEGDTYKFDWVLDDSIDKSEPVAITAKATDNEGGESVTNPVNIIIWSKQLPEVTITAPEAGTLYCASIGGVTMEVKPKIEFATADSDGTVIAVNVYVDGNPGIAVDNPAEATSYTLTEDLAIGEHTITVEVIDDDNQKAYDNVTVTVEAQGKAGYIFNEDYTTEDLLVKWNKSGEAEFSTDENGIAISGTGSAYRTVQYNFSDKAFVADIKVSFADTAADRTVKIGDKELATFSASGKITYGGSQVGGLTYQAGEVYNITAVVDAETNKVYSLVNGAEVGSVSAEFTYNAKVAVSQTGAGVVTIKNVSVSAIGDAVIPTVVVNGSKITVNFPAGVDVSTLDGNVSVVNVETGKAASLIFENGTFTINEVLKYDTDYKVMVLPDVRDVNGNGYSGTFEYTFTTPEPPTVGIAGVGVTAPTLADGNFTATLEVDFNGAAETKTVYLVCAAYKGAKMEDHQVITLTAPATASDIALALSGVSADAVIEAFVVDSLDDLNSVSDKIFVIK